MSVSAQVRARADQIALRWFALPGIIGAVIALAWFLGRGLSTLPLTGPDSIGRSAITLSVLAGMTSYAVAYYQTVHPTLKKKDKQWVFWRDLATLTFAHSVLLLAATALLTFVFNTAFKGLLLDPYTSAFIVGLAVAASCYVMIYLAMSVNTEELIVAVSTILIGGVLLAMVTNNQPDWWQINFSYLGSADSSNPIAFNLTLITSALVMLSLTQYIFSSFTQSTKDKNLTYLKWLFVLVALSLGAVGLFPYTPDSILATLHNLSAGLLVVGILTMIGTLRRLVPTLPTEFYVTSYVFGGGLVLATILFKWVGYLTLTAYELVAFGVSFVWLILFLRNLQFNLGSKTAKA